MSAKGAVGLLLILSVALAVRVAMAGPPYVPIEQRLKPEQLTATGLDTLTPGQLALLNDLLRESTVSGETARQPHAGEPTVRQSFIGLDDKAIHSRLKGSISAWGPGTVFELENGQRWQVLKGSMTLAKPLLAPVVELVPGIAGRWFLHVGDDDLPGARVYRVD